MTTAASETTPPTRQRPVIPAWGMALAALLAALCFAWFIRQGWKESPHSSQHYASVHSTIGILFSQQGRLDDAADQFRRALALDPSHAEACNNLGNILLQQGKLEEAVECYRKALQMRPKYADAQNNLGLVLLQKGRLDEAIGHFHAALDLRPSYADAENNLGYALLQRGRFPEAQRHFEASVKLNPGIGQAHHNLALTLFQQGRVAEAVARYEIAIKTNPQQLGSLNNLAWILSTSPDASLRDGMRALEAAQQANTLSGGRDPIILHTLAAALAESGQFTEAAEFARKALDGASASGNGPLADAIREQLRTYEAGAPFRETVAPPGS
jgi:tetratricopeptide (TPR) repeat protein